MIILISLLFIFFLNLSCSRDYDRDYFMVIEENHGIGGYYKYWVFNMHRFRKISFIWVIFHIHRDAYDGASLGRREKRGTVGERKDAEQPEGFATEGQKCFPVPPDYFSFRSEFPFRAVPRFPSWNLNWLNCGLHLYHSFQSNTSQAWEGVNVADIKCWNNSGPTTKHDTRRQFD